MKKNNFEQKNFKLEKMKISNDIQEHKENDKIEEKKIKRENNLKIQEFLDFLKYEKGSSDNTLSGYKRDLKQFFLSVEKNIEKVDESDIYTYIEKLKKKLKRNSVLRKVSAIRTFFRFCYLNKIVNHDPTNMIRGLKREKKLPEVLTLKEIQKIIDNCNHTPEGMQNKMVIKLLIATGARISEILNLEIKNIESQEYEFVKVLGKGSKYRLIPIYDSLEKEIKDYLENYRSQLKNANKNFKLFPNMSREKFWKTLKKISRDAGIEKNVYPHIFRHSLATILLGNGADIRIVQEILGHSNIATTEIYTHVEKSTLKKIYNSIKLGDD